MEVKDGEKKKGKDRGENKMKEESQRGEHRVIKGRTRRGKGETGAVHQPEGSAV